MAFEMEGRNEIAAVEVEEASVENGPRQIVRPTGIGIGIDLKSNHFAIVFKCGLIL